MNIEGKVALVTGGNRGIGKAIVEALLDEGASKIYATARNLETMPNFNSNRVIPIELDITDHEKINTTSKKISDINLLINNAGHLSFSSALEGDFDKVRYDMEVNYFGLLAMMRAFVPTLEKNNDSAIVNIDSIAAFVNFPHHGGYCASKSAAFSITQCARIELAKRGISVHSVNPGPIDTDMTKNIEMDKTSPEDTAKAILNRLKNDEADIFPDKTGQNMFELYKEDYQKLEELSSNFFHSEQ